ncbi:hypothetical protein Q8A73_018009 [Channa argus]|nr:hypothetical protein Q8A73_018009 [Channa argus]
MRICPGQSDKEQRKRPEVRCAGHSSAQQLVGLADSLRDSNRQPAAAATSEPPGFRRTPHGPSLGSRFSALSVARVCVREISHWDPVQRSSGENGLITLETPSAASAQEIPQLPGDRASPPGGAVFYRPLRGIESPGLSLTENGI